MQKFSRYEVIPDGRVPHSGHRGEKRIPHGQPGEPRPTSLEVWPCREDCPNLVLDKLTCLFLVHLVQVDNGHHDFREKPDGLLRKLDHRREIPLAIDPHQVTILLWIGGVQTDGDGIYQSDKLGDNIPFVNDSAVTIGIQTRPSSLCLHPAGDFLECIETDRGFPETTEDNLIIFGRILNISNNLLRRRLPLDPEICPLDDSLALPVTENAIGITADGEVDVQ